MTATNESLIRMTDVKKTFFTDEVETHALGGIYLAINPGEYVAVAGPSGCGKSTLLSILGLLDSPTEGQYLLKGRPSEKLSFSERARIRNREIGFIFQSFNLIGDLTVLENVELPLTYRRDMRAAERKRLAIGALDRVGMSHRERHFPSQLSGGQQQRVAVARALAGTPSILLADEPTGNLDSENGATVMELLSKLHGSGATICIVTHDNRYAALAQRTVHLFDGRIVEDQLTKDTPGNVNSFPHRDGARRAEQKLSLGFNPSNLLTANITPTDPKYKDPLRIRDLFDAILEKARHLPGVTSAAMNQDQPFEWTFGDFAVPFRVPGQPELEADKAPKMCIQPISSDYFTTLGVPLLSGRDFDIRDQADRGNVTIIDRAFAERFFPNQNPNGKHIEDLEGDTGKLDLVIVGVVQNSRHNRPENAPADFQVFVPYVQYPNLYRQFLLLRTRGDPGALIPAVQRIVASVDPGTPVTHLQSFDGLIS
jgi:putative ABC transport system ATP-binding protein